MGLDRKDIGLCVKMSNSGHPHAAGRYAEGSVLEGLEFLDGGGGSIREPDGAGVCEEGSNEGLVGDDKGLLLLAPTSPG